MFENPSLGSALAFVVFFSPGALAQEADSTGAEIDRQLRASLSEMPPPTLEVNFVPLDNSGYRLEEVLLNVDGQPVTIPDLSTLRSGGKQKLFGGAVTEGRHHIAVKYVYTADAGLFSYMTGYKFTLGCPATVNTQRGLLTAVDVGTHIDPSINDWKKALVVKASRHDTMLAKLDDGDLPPPPPRFVSAPEPTAPATTVSVAEASPSDAPAADRKKGKTHSRVPKQVRTKTVAMATTTRKVVAKEIQAAAPEEAKAVVAATVAEAAPIVASPAATPPAVAIAAQAPVAAMHPAALTESGMSTGMLLLIGGGLLVVAGLFLAILRRRKPLELPPE